MSVRTGVPQPIPGMMPSPMGGMPPSPMGGMMPPMGGMPQPPGMNPQMPGAPSVPPGGVPGGRPGVGPGSASTGTLPSPSSVRQRAGFAQFAGSIQNAPAPQPPMGQGLGGAPMGPVGSMPQNVFAAPGQMMSPGRGSMPVPALPGRQPVGMRDGGQVPQPMAGVRYMQEGGVPEWVDPSYGYNPDRPRKPNLREVMNATGLDFKGASNLLYGVVGANTDVRDWSSILSGEDPVSAARLATGEMYSNPAATAETLALSTRDPSLIGTQIPGEEEGVLYKYRGYDNPSGQINVVEGDDGKYAIVSGGGLGLRAGFSDRATAERQARDFGYQPQLGDASGVSGAMADPMNMGIASSGVFRKADPSGIIQDNAGPNDPKMFAQGSTGSGGGLDFSGTIDLSGLIGSSVGAGGNLQYIRDASGNLTPVGINPPEGMRGWNSTAAGYLADGVLTDAERADLERLYSLSDPSSPNVIQDTIDAFMGRLPSTESVQRYFPNGNQTGLIDQTGAGQAGQTGSGLIDQTGQTGSGQAGQVDQSGSGQTGQTGAGSSASQPLMTFNPPFGSVYQPTVYGVPSFVTGMSDIYGTRPVSFVGPPEAQVQGILGDITLPARQESINVYDWLGQRVTGMRDGGLAGGLGSVAYMEEGGDPLAAYSGKSAGAPEGSTPQYYKDPATGKLFYGIGSQPGAITADQDALKREFQSTVMQKDVTDKLISDYFAANPLARAENAVALGRGRDPETRAYDPNSIWVADVSSRIMPETLAAAQEWSMSRGSSSQPVVSEPVDTGPIDTGPVDPISDAISEDVRLEETFDPYSPGGSSVPVGTIDSVVGIEPGTVIRTEPAYTDSFTIRGISDVSPSPSAGEFSSASSSQPLIFNPPFGSVYQPTTSDIPSFVRGMGDIYGTRPVSYVTSPQAQIQGILGNINLPARQEQINIFDWLGERVTGMRRGGVAGRPFDRVSYFKKGGETEKQSKDYGARDEDMSVGRAPSGGVSSGGGGRDFDADMDPFGGGGGSYGGGGGGGRNLDADMDPFGDYETGGGGGGGSFGSPAPTPRPDRLAGTTGTVGGGGGTSRTSGTTPVMSADTIAADTAATAPEMSGIEGFARRFGPDIVGAMIGGIPGLAVANLGRMALSGEFGPATAQSGVQALSDRSFMPGQGEGERRSLYEQLFPSDESDELEQAVEEEEEAVTEPVVEPYKTETLDEILARITVPAQSIAPMGGNPFLPQGSQFARPMRDGGAVDYRAMARREAERVGLDPDIYERLIERESSYNPGAVSPKGARGLAQVMPGTARDPGFGVKPLADPFDPAESLRFGADYLAALRNEFGGDYGQALAAYNAGIGRVRKAGGIPDIKETRDYVDYILNNRSPAPRRRPANLASDTIRRPEPRPTLAGALSEVMQPAPRKKAPVPQMRAPAAPMGREERMQQLQAASTPGESLGAAADRFLSRLGMQ